MFIKQKFIYQQKIVLSALVLGVGGGGVLCLFFVDVFANCFNKDCLITIQFTSVVRVFKQRCSLYECRPCDIVCCRTAANTVQFVETGCLKTCQMVFTWGLLLMCNKCFLLNCSSSYFLLQAFGIHTYRYIHIHIYIYIYIYLHIHTYIYIYIYIHIYIHIHTYIYIYIHTHTYIYIHTHIYTHTHIYIYIYIHTYIYIYAYIYIHTYIYIHIHIYTHIYIYIYIFVVFFVFFKLLFNFLLNLFIFIIHLKCLTSVVERQLMVRGVVDQSLVVDPLSYFSFQPVLHDWCYKDSGVCYPVCGMVHIKEPLLLIRKSSPCSDPVLYDLTPHNCK